MFCTFLIISTHFPKLTISVSQTSTRIPRWIHYSANEVWANVFYLNLFLLHVFIFILILFLFSCQYYTTMTYIRTVPPSVLCNLRMGECLKIQYVFHPPAYHLTSHPITSLCPNFPASPPRPCQMHSIANSSGLPTQLPFHHSNCPYLHSIPCGHRYSSLTEGT